MQFGIFYEHQLPRPWAAGAEQRLLLDALEQVELADRLGIDYVWEVEHHFLEEYSHSSAPELFLAACSQRTKAIRLGHGIVLMPPKFNHPARVAERIATLDLLSNGRVEWGAGKGSSRIELAGFNVDPELRQAMWFEAVRETAKMMCTTPYPGFQGDYFSMPVRNVVPKPLQQPHPPLWMACSNRASIAEAARLGIGALCFAFVDAADAKHWVDEYYDTFKQACHPIGQTVNPNVAMVTGFMCHQESETAVRQGLEGFQFFGYALSHYYLHGVHQPGTFDLWADFQQNRPPGREPTGCIGNPAQVRAKLEQFEAMGVDQVILIQQAGNNRQADICAALELFAGEILPAFQDRHHRRAQQKAAELAPYIEKAMRHIEPIALSASPQVEAYPLLAHQQTPSPVASATDKRESGEQMARVITGTL